MWFLLSSDTVGKINTVGTPQHYSPTKFIVRQDNLTEFLLKNGGNWTVERIQEWTPKVHLDNEKNKAIQSLAEPLSR